MALYRVKIYHTHAGQNQTQRLRIPGKAADHTPEQINEAVQNLISTTWVQPQHAEFKSIEHIR